MAAMPTTREIRYTIAKCGEVLKRTRASKGSAAGLSTLAEELSATMQEVAGNVSSINNNMDSVKAEVHNIATDCTSIASYTVQNSQ